MPVPQPPDRPHGANLLRRPEGIPQQTICVQLHQPLTLLHIRLTPRQVFWCPELCSGISRIQPVPERRIPHSRTPVDCITTCLMPPDFSHSAIRTISAVPLPNSVPAPRHMPAAQPHNGFCCRYRCPLHADGESPVRDRPRHQSPGDYSLPRPVLYYFARIARPT